MHLNKLFGSTKIGDASFATVCKLKNVSFHFAFVIFIKYSPHLWFFIQLLTDKYILHGLPTPQYKETVSIKNNTHKMKMITNS